MQRSFLLFPVLLAGFVSSNVVYANSTVSSRGFGETELKAVEDAKKKAIAKVCGETIVGSSRLQTDTEKRTKLNSGGASSRSLDSTTKSSDDSIALVGGAIKSHKVISVGEEGGVKYVDLQAVVSDCKSGDSVQATIDNKAMISQLAKISSELKNLSGNDSVIKNPKTIAQKYHNARTLSQRGEIDAALNAYQSVLKEKIIFADPIQDFVTLSKRLYGVEGSKKFIEKSLPHLRDRPEYLYALSLSDEALIQDWDRVRQSSSTFPPLAFVDLKSRYGKCFSERKDTNPCLKEIVELPGARAISERLIALEKSGGVLQFYIDSNKASLDTEDFKDMFSDRFWSMFDLDKSMRNSKSDVEKLDLLMESAKSRGVEIDSDLEKKMSRVREAMKNAPPNPFSAK